MPVSPNMFNFLRKEEQTTGLIFNPEHDNDPRNIRWEDIMPLAGQEVPESGDVEKGNWTLNQVLTTACSCHSTVYKYNQEKEKRLSPRYAFYTIKTDSKYPSSQLPHGAYMVDSLKLLVNEGICSYELYPNMYEGSDADYLHFPPPYSAKEDAGKNKGGSYVYVVSTGDDATKFDAIRSYLATSGKSCKVGIVWRTSFNNARKTGLVPAEAATGNAVGHDMLAVAWKRINGQEYLGFRNSFGPTWGDAGRIWLPKGFFKIQSAITYLPPAEALEIVKPVVVENRDYFLEKSNAQKLRAAIYEKFPLAVATEAHDANYEARALMGRMWLVIVMAVTYFGFTNTDIINFLYARSRKKTDTKAYSLDLTKKKV